jgi:RNA polymerase sigma-70 factor (ECF subfamily)
MTKLHQSPFFWGILADNHKSCWVLLLDWVARQLFPPMQVMAPTINDREAQGIRLLEAMVKRDRQALADFYELYGKVLYSLIYKIVGNGPDAEELTQDIFVYAWEHAATFDSRRGTPFTWIVLIARRRAIDHLRRRVRRDRYEKSLPEQIESTPDPAPDARDNAEASDQGQQVSTALAMLPDDQSQALRLAYFNGMTQQEIANRMNVPLGTIKARLRRGLLRLRECLNQEEVA